MVGRELCNYVRHLWLISIGLSLRKIIKFGEVTMKCFCMPNEEDCGSHGEGPGMSRNCDTKVNEV